MKKLGLGVYGQLRALGMQFRHLKELDETRPERVFLSGAVNLSAAERNAARLKFYFVNEEQCVYCGKYAMAALEERVGQVKARNGL